MAVDFETLTDEEYFAELKLMFSTDGWDILMSELLDQAKMVNDVQEVKDLDDLFYRKGQLAAMGVLLNFEETIRRASEDSETQEIADSVEDV